MAVCLVTFGDCFGEKWSRLEVRLKVVSFFGRNGHDFGFIGERASPSMSATPACLSVCTAPCIAPSINENKQSTKQRRSTNNEDAAANNHEDIDTNTKSKEDNKTTNTIINDAGVEKKSEWRS